MIISVILAVLALFVCPAAYIALCIWMGAASVQRPPYLSLFFVFGTVGGWMLAFALSPSGLAAVSIIFLVTAAPLALLVSSIFLAIRRERTIYHRVALWGGFTYPALLFAFWILTNFIYGLAGPRP
jgi:hypothetical protein